MGFFKNLFRKEFFTGSFYVVDLGTLRTYLEDACQFTLDEKLNYVTEVYIYAGGEKIHLEAWTQSESLDDDMPGKGFVFTCDDVEYFSLDSLFAQKLRFLPPYFKINLPLGDDVWLNKYKAEHPELRVEDF